MRVVWVVGSLAVTLEELDFLDPAATGPDARERGVRLELRAVDEHDNGSIYASPALALAPGLCRIDLLESAPGAADRMHWHPGMAGGEPGPREFDPELSADPLGWTRARLGDPMGLLRRVGVADAERFEADAAGLAACADEIVERVATGLRRLRRPWPPADHDHRGMAPVPLG